MIPLSDPFRYNLRRIVPLLLAIAVAACRSGSGDKQATTTPDSTGVHVFVYRDSEAKSVHLAGSFNDWEPRDVLEKKDKILWMLAKPLPPGYYQYKFVVDGQWVPDPTNEWRINDGGSSVNSIIRVGNPPVPRRKTRPEPFDSSKVPAPILDAHPEWVELYYKAWELAWQKVSKGTEANGFEPAFMDEGFNDQIYQWDDCFITRFAIYGRDAFPVMATLDNFYRKQRRNGYIQRVYSEKDGQEAREPTPEEPMVNPPLFAWVECEYYTLTGDSSRIVRVLPHLVEYFNWSEKYCRGPQGKGLYYTTPLGSGMDNTPRPEVGQGGWVDFSSQQALAALCISRLAKVVGQGALSERFRAAHQIIADRINRYCYDRRQGFYFDLTQEGARSPILHIGGFWPMLAEVTTGNTAERLTAHLTNPAEFWRPNLIPTLAANQDAYDSRGHYWLGSVWAPTNYMVMRGLMRQHSLRFNALADSIAWNHLRLLSRVYRDFRPHPDSLAFEERYGDGYHTLWECYSSERPTPATRWDGTFYSRQDFVGWTGLGPVAMLIENALGLDVEGSSNTIRWTIKNPGRQGIRRLRLKDQLVSLIYSEERGKPVVTVTCQKSFNLEIAKGATKKTYTAKSGVQKIVL